MPGTWMKYCFAAMLPVIVNMQGLEPIKGPFSLSGDSPVCIIPFHRDFVTRAPTAIDVTVDSIVENGASDLTIKVFIENAKDSFFIGSFSSYPIAKPGKFILSLHRYGAILASDQKKGNKKETAALLKFVLAPNPGKPNILVHIQSVSWIVEGP